MTSHIQETPTLRVRGGGQKIVGKQMNQISGFCASTITKLEHMIKTKNVPVVLSNPQFEPQTTSFLQTDVVRHLTGARECSEQKLHNQASRK